MLMTLRTQLTHALTQRDISPKKFNDIREQLLPLDEQLRKLGVDVSPTPQMNPNYVRPTRRQKRNSKQHRSFTDRINLRYGVRRDADD
jgi:hypothetical protein